MEPVLVGEKRLLEDVEAGLAVARVLRVLELQAPLFAVPLPRGAVDEDQAEDDVRHLLASEQPFELVLRQARDVLGLLVLLLWLRVDDRLVAHRVGPGDPLLADGVLKEAGERVAVV